MGHLAQVLVDRYGAENVSVVTGRPNYPDGVLTSGYKWRLWKKRTGPNGERILSLYEIPAPFRGFLRKTIGYLSFAFSAFVYLVCTRFRRGDVVIVTSPPIFLAYAVMLASCVKKNLDYILDVRDLWPEGGLGMGFLKESSHTYRILDRLTKATYRRAIRIIAVEHGIHRHISKLEGASKVTMIPSPVNMDLFRVMDASDVSAFRMAHSDLFGTENERVFLFSGAFSVYVDLMVLLRALTRVQEKTDAFRFLLIGYGEEEDKLREYVDEHGLDNKVKFVPFMPREELVNYIGSADACFASLRNVPCFECAIPTKVLEYLTCDKFIVASLGGPFAAELQEKGLALVSARGDENALALSIMRVIEHPEVCEAKQSARDYIEANFSPSCFRTRILALLEEDVKVKSERS